MHRSETMEVPLQIPDKGIKQVYTCASLISQQVPTIKIGVI